MTDQEAFSMLSEPVRHFISQKQWTSFRPIQKAAIGYIMTTDKNYILSSRTASGKTEAAFLPILSMINPAESGVQVLYISPLIALINDQMQRVEELCGYMNITITKWHGEASESHKKKLLKDPNGIMLITPESIEAMFQNHPERINLLFDHLKFIVIDEIHYFAEGDRGLQLESLLSRLKQKIEHSFRVIGLSATIGNPELTKQLTADAANTVILRDAKPKEVDFSFKYFYQDKPNEFTLDFIKDLYKETCRSKALVFPNRRSCVEEISVKLKKIAEKIKEHTNYFSHHASVTRDIREYAEFFAKSKDEDYVIACTSTLELGIDIGRLDKVVQVGATNTVSSLVQRAGRSGRAENANGKMTVYATDKWDQLQSLACYRLYKEGKLEETTAVSKPYDILVHQLLSIVKEKSEIGVTPLLEALQQNSAFNQITKEDILLVIKYLINEQMLELIEDQLILGVKGERLAGSRDFYSVFTTEKDYTVIYNGHSIGELQVEGNPMEGEYIYLSARIWQIEEIDSAKRKIFVKEAHSGKRPRYVAEGGDTSLIVERKMLDILRHSTECEELDEDGQLAIADLAKGGEGIYDKDVPYRFSGEQTKPSLTITPLMGTNVLRTLALIFKNNFESTGVVGSQICIEGDQIAGRMQKLKSLTEADFKGYVQKEVKDNPQLMDICSKYGYLLPESLQSSLLQQKMYDFEKANLALQCLIEDIEKG